MTLQIKQWAEGVGMQLRLETKQPGPNAILMMSLHFCIHAFKLRRNYLKNPFTRFGPSAPVET